MEFTARRMTVTGVVACIVLLGASGPGAVAAPKRITGKLTKRGYDVIALAANGKAVSARARPRFKLRPPAKRVTLHLRRRDGTYGGPVVVAKQRRGKRAIVGVAAGAKLGKVKVIGRRGYATTKLRKKWRDLERWARAKKGVPRGAGRFGRVRSKPPRESAPGDRDVDGIPDALDIDDDGDLVLDHLDRAAPRRATRSVGAPAAGVAQEANEFRIASVLPLPIEVTANVNAGSTDTEIEAALPDWGSLIVQHVPGDSSELDCGGAPDPLNPQGWNGGLSYCTRGGTGAAVVNPGSEPEPYPECCDADGDGFGTLLASAGGGSPGDVHFFLDHGATTAAIATGDLLVQRISAGGTESQFAAMLPFVFATGPALVSYADGQGNSRNVDYPVSAGPPGGGCCGDPGTNGNGFPVAAGPDGNIVLTLTLWRPQRRPIEREECPPPDGRLCEPGEWIDIGGLRHSAVVQDIEFRGGVGGDCPRSAYSEVDPPDPELTPAETSPFTTATGFTDLAPDRLAAGDAFTYRLNLTKCLRGTPWDVGEELGMTFQSSTNIPLSEAVQTVRFKRQG